MSEKLRALLHIASKVQKAAKTVDHEDIKAAMKHGPTERDIHDTVLIASAFCMYNRYVDGLGTFAPPRGDRAYEEMGKMIGQNGYVRL